MSKDLFAKLCEHGACCYCSTNNACYVRTHCLHQQVVGRVVFQAVSDLSAQGVVEGYPDGTFKGEKNMTRYELAQIVARLMAKEDQLNAEQQATIDKLAGEYADELANLGVRVSNLEKKVGNIYWSGNARMRYQDKGDNKTDWNGRIRINVKGQVNENTAVNARFLNNFKFKNGADSTTVMDRIYVDHKFGDTVAAKLGRYEVDAGGFNTWLISAAFDDDCCFMRRVGSPRLCPAFSNYQG